MKSLQDYILESGKKLKNNETLERTVEIALDTVYNDGYDSPSEAQKELKKVADGDKDAPIIDYVISVVCADEPEVEDEIYDRWDEVFDTIQRLAKEWLS